MTASTTSLGQWFRTRNQQTIDLLSSDPLNKALLAYDKAIDMDWGNTERRAEELRRLYDRAVELFTSQSHFFRATLSNGRVYELLTNRETKGFYLRRKR